MYIVTAKEMYDIDHYTMHEIGMAGKLLMENAGRAVSDKVMQVVGAKDRISVFVGSGNNVVMDLLLQELCWIKGIESK